MAKTYGIPTQRDFPLANTGAKEACKSCLNSRATSVAIAVIATIAAAFIILGALGLSGHLSTVMKFIANNSIPFTIAASIGLIAFTALGFGLGCTKPKQIEE